MSGISPEKGSVKLAEIVSGEELAPILSGLTALTGLIWQVTGSGGEIIAGTGEMPEPAGSEYEDSSGRGLASYLQDGNWPEPDTAGAKMSDPRFILPLKWDGECLGYLRSSHVDPAKPGIRDIFSVVNLFSEVMVSCWVNKWQTARLLREEDHLAELLVRSEEQLSFAIEATNDGLWDWYPQSGKAWFSPQYYRMLGYENKAFAAGFDKWKQLVHPDDLPFIMQKIEETVKTGKEFAEEFRMRLKDEGWIWVLGRGKATEFGPDGKVLRLVGTHINIHERKMSEERSKERELRAGKQRASLARLVMDPAVAYGDPFSSLKIITRTLADTIGVARASVWQLADNRSILQCLMLYQSENNTWSSGERLKTADFPSYFKAIEAENRVYASDAQSDHRTCELTEFYLKKMNISSLLDAGILMDGTLFGVVSCEHMGPKRKWHPDEESFVSTIAAIVSQVFTNYKRKQAESDLIAAKEKAEESDRLKSAFLINMNHEFRTPMNAIMGFADQMLEADINDLPRYARIIHQSSAQLLSVIEDVVYLSKLQSGRIQAEPGVFSPAKIIHNLIGMYDVPGHTKGLVIKAVIPSGYHSLSMVSDEPKIRHIISLLLSNAMKYTREGHIMAGFRISHTEIEFFVQDTGMGIPEKEQKLIFENFYRGEAAIAEAIGGSGLGLNICRELVRILGGRITLRSQAGIGSCFSFFLPLTETGSLPDSPAREITRLPGWPASRILIAEDEPDNFFLLEVMLRKKVHSIERALNGKEALEKVVKNHYDLILMDLKMPVMGGIEAVMKIRQVHSDIPVIAQTAHSEPAELQNALNAGCNDYLIKPIRKEHLFQMLNKYLSGN